MNLRLVAGIAGLAMLLTAGFDVSESHAIGRKCGGKSSCGGGLFSGRCGGREPRAKKCGGGLLAKLKAKKASCGCPEPDPCCTPEPTCCTPEPTCCTPAPTCCEPAPVDCGCAAPAPACGGCAAPVTDCGCATVQPSCGGCAAPMSDCGCGTMMTSTIMVAPAGCTNCSQTMDGGIIYESAAPAEAPPAPVADSASDTPST
jgi:hypothetical protein